MRYRPIAIFIACLAFAAPSAAETVGSMTAYQTNIVRNNGGTMNVGAGVELGDQLRSDPTGLGMLVFRDESSAKIGPNTSLTIDEFVYNPGSGSGKIDIGMDSGLARFYGGQVSKRGVMQVATPHMVLGARGGIIEVLVAAGQTVGILRAGRMTCTINGKRIVITNPGYACIGRWQAAGRLRWNRHLPDIGQYRPDSRHRPARRTGPWIGRKRNLCVGTRRLAQSLRLHGRRIARSGHGIP